jgi:aspartate/methionine/tyrosine aminotransferase
MNIAPFRLERFFARYEFKAPYLLASSDCESVSVGDLLAFEPEMETVLKDLWLGYTETKGHPELRQAIAQLYETVSPAQVLVHTGAEEAIFTFLAGLFSAGDHLIVHWPGYQSHVSVAEALGCEVTRWMTSDDEQWMLDLDFLRETIRPETKAVIVNTPHNPTGYHMSRTIQQQLVQIASDHNLLLFFDEVYRGLEYDPADLLPAACDLYDNAISLGVMSKTYGLAGLRIGWVATRNPQILDSMLAVKDYTTICNSAPSELLATVALRHRDKLVARNLSIIRENLTLLGGFFARYEEIFDWVPPRAGPIAFPRLKLQRAIEAFCLELVEQEGVMLVPGTNFDDDQSHFRIGFGRRNMPEALDRFERFVERQV